MKNYWFFIVIFFSDKNQKLTVFLEVLHLYISTLFAYDCIKCLIISRHI